MNNNSDKGPSQPQDPDMMNEDSHIESVCRSYFTTNTVRRSYSRDYVFR